MNNSDILGEEAAFRQIISNDFSATNGVFEDDSITFLKHSAFRGRTNLRRVILPSLIRFGDTVSGANKYNGFYDCTNLSCVDFGGGDSLSNTYFQGCFALTDIFLREESNIVALQNQNTFAGTPIEVNSGDNGCNIYVPRNLISAYQTATNWSVLYAAHTNLFKAIEDYTVDGTVKGDINWSLIDPVETPIYTLENQEFTGSTPVIDTNVQLFNTIQPEFTVIIDMTHYMRGSGSMQNRVFACYNNGGFYISRSGTSENINVGLRTLGSSSSRSTTYTWGYGNRGQIAAVVKNNLLYTLFVKDGQITNVFFNNNGGVTPSSTISDTAKIGKSDSYGAFTGTIHSLKVYNKALNARQILRELGV